jgi:hypothetical protein
MGALLAIFLVNHWRRSGVVVFGLVIAIPVLGTAYTISRFQYQKEFLPVVRIIQENGGRVTGDAQLGFGLGFTPRLVDDHRLGFYSGAKTSVFAIDGAYDEAREKYKTTFPEIYSFINEKTARSRLLFANSLYRVYLDPDPK